ncbi:intracellular protein transport protein USO1 [Mercurialis annua]|uniref:intracellular protein transport protein USO1 n=1 Tax=Mercurialis annua TaxID=3986 RepID=UPI00215F7BC1|nr:intracellular protein transport protein USO1 [Mercurialis annua]
MAKKKPTHQTRDSKKQSPPDHSAMEDLEEQLQNLRTLNDMLLKDTIEHRQKIDSLTRAQEVLDSQLVVMGTEKMDLENKLSVDSEERLRLEIEKGLFGVFVQTQMVNVGIIVEKKEHEIEFLKNKVNELIFTVESERKKLSLAARERDVLRDDVDKWKKVTNELMQVRSDLEDREMVFKEEIKKLEARCSFLVKQNQEIEMQCNVAKMEKNEIERERDDQKVVISDLERRVSFSDGVIGSLREEADVSSEKFLELEMSYGAEQAKGKVLSMQIDDLVKQKNDMKKIMGKLMLQTESSDGLIESLNREMKDKIGLIEKLFSEKKEIEDVKDVKESEIVNLQKDLGGLKDDVAAMKESIKDQEDKNKQLATEARRYKDEFEKACLESDNVQRSLDEEQRNVTSLRIRVLEMEKRIEETGKEVAKMKNKPENLLELKEEKFDGEIEPYAAELEGIKNAFRNKESLVEEMKQQMNILQNSEAEARKRTGLWTIVSSATTFLAAASLAYAAKIR